jgi:hypothetical protein
VHTGRRRGKSHSRILYWFRTPPGVRVGRAALDEDAIRLIEQHNPGVEFDWTRILKGQDAPPEPTSQPERRTRPRGRDFPAPRPFVPREKGPAPAAPADVPAAPDLTDRPSSDREPASEPEPPPAEAQEAGERPRSAEARSDDPVSGAPLTPAQVRLGFEGLSRLRARHAEVLARISEKVSDAAARDELKSAAERLNPDTWVTEAEVSAGLESYESVFESLRGVVGRRRKRRGPPPSGPGVAPQAAAAETPEDSRGGPNEPGEDA